MGSGSRTEMCNKFIEEFNDDYIAAIGIEDGNTVIVSEGLGTHDLYECVFHYVTIRTNNAAEFLLMRPDVVFDPEGLDYNLEAYIQDMAVILGKSEEEIEKRFSKAGLL